MDLHADFAEYLSRLVGRGVAVDEALNLSSGQQARAAGWLAERGFAPPQLRAQLGGRFTPAGLLGAGEASRPLTTPRPGPRPRSVGRTRAAHRVGIDIQRVEEVVPSEALADLKSSAELAAIFTMREISYAQSRPTPAETLCGLFCAKEALRKCDPALLEQPLTEIEVLPDEHGAPRFDGYALSVSHSGGFAIAVAVSDQTTES
jgi:phosphopantetheinyl transferase (holo-ACP synthase)